MPSDHVFTIPSLKIVHADATEYNGGLVMDLFRLLNSCKETKRIALLSGYNCNLKAYSYPEPQTNKHHKDDFWFFIECNNFSKQRALLIDALANVRWHMSIIRVNVPACNSQCQKPICFLRWNVSHIYESILKITGKLNDVRNAFETNSPDKHLSARKFLC